MSKVLKKISLNKEQALDNFVDMIEKSWTYNRLTKEEKERLRDVFYNIQTRECLKGTYIQRWEILQAIYHSYLMALDYKPIGWREED